MKANLLFLDTETTGFAHNRLLQLGFEHHPSGQQYDEIFLPPVPVEKGATEVHGITQLQANGGYVFKESAAHQLLLDHIQKGAIVVCHNTDYDIGKVLKNEGIAVPRYICTMKVARQLLPSEPNHKLQDLCSRIGFTCPEHPRKAHDAFSDVMTMIGLFAYLCKIERADERSDEEIIAKFEKLSTGIPDVMPFGKFKGIEFAKLPEDYVAWMMTKNDWSSDILQAVWGAWPQYAPKL